MAIQKNIACQSRKSPISIFLSAASKPPFFAPSKKTSTSQSLPHPTNWPPNLATNKSPTSPRASKPPRLTFSFANSKPLQKPTQPNLSFSPAASPPTSSSAPNSKKPSPKPTKFSIQNQNTAPTMAPWSPRLPISPFKPATSLPTHTRSIFRPAPPFTKILHKHNKYIVQSSPCRGHFLS